MVRAHLKGVKRFSGSFAGVTGLLKEWHPLGRVHCGEGTSMNNPVKIHHEPDPGNDLVPEGFVIRDKHIDSYDGCGG